MTTYDNSTYSATPRYDRNDARNPSCVADAIADLTDQVARIANALECQLNVNPSTFPKSSAIGEPVPVRSESDETGVCSDCADCGHTTHCGNVCEPEAVRSESDETPTTSELLPATTLVDGESEAAQR